MENLNQVKKDLKRICKDINYLQKAELRSLENMEAFEKRLKKFSPETLSQSLGRWKNETLELFKKNQTEQQQKFGNYVAEFIRMQHKHNVPLKELHNSWRVKQLKIMLKPETYSIKFTYNEQTVLDWKKISSTAEIEKFYDQAAEQLEKHALPTEFLVDLFLQAYEHTCMFRQKGQKGILSYVPIKDFYIETQIELFRAKLFSKKIKVEKLPQWAFLYNLDRYFADYKNIPQDKKILVLTGSQHEIQKGMGMMINGLNPLNEYKTVCYLKKG